MGRAVVVTSGKGGVGKTTLTANIGVALAMLGKKVVLIDGDIGLRNLDVVLGLEHRIIYDLVDVVQGTCRLRQALIRDKRYPELQILPAAQAASKSEMKPSDVRKIVGELKGDFDYVLVDCPAGIEQGFQNAIAGADEALIVVIPEVSSVRDADRVIGLLNAEGVVNHCLVVNRYNKQMVKRGDMMDTDDILEVLGVDLLGVVPEDMGVIRSSNIGQPLASTGRDSAAQAIRAIAASMTGEMTPEAPVRTSFMTKLRRIFSQSA